MQGNLPKICLASDIVAYIDEAGEKGFLRNLSHDRDSKVGLICCLAYPAERLDEMREAYRDGFNRFCAAAPIGEKTHITDAFRSGNEPWAAVARNVREEFFGLIRSQEVHVIYDARRLMLQREAHERMEALRAEARAAKRSTIRISERPSADRVETQLIRGLTLKLDALATDLNRSCVDLYFDEIDIELSRHYEQTIEGLRNISANSHEVKGWDPNTKQQVRGRINFSIKNAPFDLDIKRIGKIKVVGKDDPLVLATDIVANALNHHLCKLPVETKLNAPASIATWALGDQVWGVIDNAFEDII
jgi:hypothetical protein